jgi:hypothetical protein
MRPAGVSNVALAGKKAALVSSTKLIISCQCAAIFNYAAQEQSYLDVVLFEVGA